MNIEVTKHIKSIETDCGTMVKTNEGISELRIYFEPNESFEFKEEVAQILEIFTQMAKKNTQL